MVLNYQDLQNQKGVLLLHQKKTETYSKGIPIVWKIPTKKNKEVRKYPGENKEELTSLNLIS